MRQHTDSLESEGFRRAYLAQPAQQPEFVPAIWCANGHLQTLLGAFARPVQSLMRHRSRLLLPDQDFIDVDWCDWPREEGLIIFHGMGGSSCARYVMELQHICNRLRLSSVAVNLRGSSGEPNNLVQAYHAGAGTDIGMMIDAVIDQFRVQMPQVQRWHIVCFSLSASMLIHWWAKQPANSRLPIGVCVTVSPPLHLARCADALNAGVGKMYQMYLLRALKSQFRIKYRFFQTMRLHEQAKKMSDYSACLRARSFWEFDHLYVAPAHGYSSVDDYYDKASALPLLKLGQWPLVLIHAEDDPLVPPVEISASSSVFDWRYACGGHVGFMSSKSGRILSSKLSEMVLNALKIQTSA